MFGTTDALSVLEQVQAIMKSKLGEGMKRAAKCARNALSAESDLVVVGAARGGEPEAFELLVRRHEARMLRVAFHITRDRENARDVVQQSFHKAFRNLERFHEKSAFSTWLTRIVINEALMLLRKERARKEISLEGHFAETSDVSFLETLDRRENPEESYDRKEKAQILLEAMNKLSREFRNALGLQLEERSLEESAKILNIAIGTLKARLFRARRQLQTLVERKARSTRHLRSSIPAEHAEWDIRAAS